MRGLVIYTNPAELARDGYEAQSTSWRPIYCFDSTKIFSRLNWSELLQAWKISGKCSYTIGTDSMSK